MEIYQARELMDEQGKGTGLYHYTCSNSAGTYAVGYCSPVKTCSDCTGRSGILRHPDEIPCERCQDKGILRKENPCPGHGTKAEAQAHYEEYLLDHADYRDNPDADEQRKCNVCGTWTTGVAFMGTWRTYHLCDEHRNREGLEVAVSKKD